MNQWEAQRSLADEDGIIYQWQYFLQAGLEDVALVC